MIKSIGIVGLGLIGGSLARAVKRYDKGIEVRAVDVDEEILRAAVADGAIDGYRLSADEWLRGCEMIIVCTGAGRVVADIGAVYAAVGQSALLTDVCSVKDFLDKVPLGARYIGGHPMAGTERSGYRHSRADLFQGARYIVTEPSAAAAAAGDQERLHTFIRMLGARPVEIGVAAHDRVMAYVSHLPHAAAYALSDVCLSEKGSEALGAGGLRDTTRIALSDPALWTEIVLSNRRNVRDALRDLIQKLEELDGALSEGRAEAIQALFEKGKKKRGKLC